MTYPIAFRPEAEQDLREACEWYESRALELSQDFLNRVDQALEHISQYPQSSPMVHRDIRRHHLKQFPHSILYVVEPSRLVVIAVYHGRRNPAEWKDRR